MTKMSAAAWLGSPIGLILLWLAGEIFVSAAPGAALGLALAVLFGFMLKTGLLFYIFRSNP
jgi:hypothetical protein